MIPNDISRRTFLVGLASLTTASVASSQSVQVLTAGQVIDRIKANIGVPARAKTVDNIIAGSAETPVKGIATTMMATLDVIQRAAESGKNMIITHEPTFYSHQDNTDILLQDPTYKFKLDFLNKHNMVVFHFHDYWHDRIPDGIATGMMKELRWDKYVDSQNPKLFTFPEISLARFAREIESKLKSRTLRVLGDPNLRIKRVLTSWGNVSQIPGIQLFARPDIDVLVIGETHEWELVEYAQDTIASGQKKALIVIGHVLSEQAGMKYCAEWLKEFINEVPIEFIPATEPFWNPSKPVG